MLVLSRVFNTIILDATNYANQDYMRVNYTLIVVYSMFLVTSSQSKTSHVFAWIWPNSDRRLVNHCAMPSIGQTWVLASIGAVVEMGALSTLKRLLMESNSSCDNRQLSLTAYVFSDRGLRFPPTLHYKLPNIVNRAKNVKIL
jgi:hypothetical protein